MSCQIIGRGYSNEGSLVVKVWDDEVAQFLNATRPLLQSCAKNLGFCGEMTRNAMRQRLAKSNLGLRTMSHVGANKEVKHNSITRQPLAYSCRIYVIKETDVMSRMLRLMLSLPMTGRAYIFTLQLQLLRVAVVTI